jgi:tetratricopeptide (TPR) repeat protein
MPPRPPPPQPSSPPSARPSSSPSDARALSRREATNLAKGADPAASVELRLAIGRDGVGIELAQAAKLGCLRISEASARLSVPRFPLDVSGGVTRFRHKRGELDRIAIELSSAAFAAWAAPKLRGVVGSGTPVVALLPHEDGATVVVRDRAPVVAAQSRPPVLAFEVVWGPRAEGLALVVTGARGVDLPAPAVALAVAVVRALLGDAARVEGASFVVEHVFAKVARAVFPDAGARAPDASEVNPVALTRAEDAWIVLGRRGAPPCPPSVRVVRALEEAQLAREADEAVAAGERGLARRALLHALERAPRHPGLCQRLAEIDRFEGGRAEAALLTLGEANAAEPKWGTLAGDLHAEAGQHDAALAAYLHAAAREHAPALRARIHERAADLARDPHDALMWLDEAVAHAPTLHHLRWMRLRKRLDVGRFEDALADAEHLDAAARGADERFAVWTEVGDGFRRAGHGARSATMFERALRYAPEEPHAVAGLGAALVDEGRAARGVALLCRAIELAEERRVHVDAMVLRLARALADSLDDKPAAIARLRAIAASSDEAVVARGLEGRFRAAIGDIAGATLAYAQLRELARSRTPDIARPLRDDEREVVELLCEAASFERDTRSDLAAAEQHLACALRLAPRDPAVRRAYQEVCAERAGVEPADEAARGRAAEAVGATEQVPDSRPEPPRGNAFAAVKFDEPDASDADAEDPSRTAEAQARDEARVEELTRKLHASPTDDAVADELADLLARLGRGHELLALLLGRLEDASPERRRELVPKTRAALEKLEADARARGHGSEASLYRDARAMLASDAD